MNWSIFSVYLNMGFLTKFFSKSSISDTNQEIEIPNWLKLLQDKSWELELIISGGAIFSLLQLSDFAINFFNYLLSSTVITGISIIKVFTMFIIKSLTLGFFFHIVARSFWISIVALSSYIEYRKPIRDIQYQKPFKNPTLKNLPDTIIKVDQYSSFLFSTSFNIVFATLGGLILIFVILSVAIRLENFEYIFYAIIITYYFDLFTFSALRKIKYVSYFLYPFFKLFDILSLRFIYFSSFEITSRYSRKIYIALYYLAFFCLSILFTYLSVQKSMKWPNVFDQRKNRFNLSENPIYYSDAHYRSKSNDAITNASIQSDIIHEPFICLHIYYSVFLDDDIERIPSPKKKNFENLFQISVNDSIYNNLSFYTLQMSGIVTYIDIQNLPTGSHLLKIENLYPDDSTKAKLIIPFSYYK